MTKCQCKIKLNKIIQKVRFFLFKRLKNGQILFRMSVALENSRPYLKEKSIPLPAPASFQIEQAAKQQTHTLFNHPKDDTKKRCILSNVCFVF